MTSPARYRIHPLAPDAVALMEAVLATFGDVFAEPETYGGKSPVAAYLRGLLGRGCFIALAALERGEVVGGLAA